MAQIVERVKDLVEEINEANLCFLLELQLWMSFLLILPHFVVRWWYVSAFRSKLYKIMSLQVTQGISEFRPTPFENRNFCQCSYNVEHNLLVDTTILEFYSRSQEKSVENCDPYIVALQVKFNFDTIDETDLLEETLKPRVESMGGTLEKVLLTGTHITPCIQVCCLTCLMLTV